MRRRRISLGADEVAARLATVDGVRVVRNGSRGMCWLEPLIEIEVAGERIAYGPVTPADVDDLLAAGVLSGGEHELRLGKTADIPFLARQDRWTFRRA